jgi:hypothetical protein
LKAALPGGFCMSTTLGSTVEARGREILRKLQLERIAWRSFIHLIKL